MREQRTGPGPFSSRLLHHALVLGLLLAVTVSTSPFYWKPKVLRSLPLVNAFEAQLPQSPHPEEAFVKSAAPSTALVNRPRVQPVLHKVRYGENLGTLADQYGISVPTIMWANDLASDIIVPDQSLLILPVSGVRHKVEEGDTIDSLAAAYQTEASAIIEFNQLTDPRRLVPGDNLVIPGGRPQAVFSAVADAGAAEGTGGLPSEGRASAVASASAATPRAPDPWTYVVKPGDVLHRIAERYGINTSTILYANNLRDPDGIYPGQELTMLPVSGVLYTVQPGDMLREVAERYGISLSSILKSNNVADPGQLIAGAEIILPGAVPIRRAAPQQVAGAPGSGVAAGGAATGSQSGASARAAAPVAAPPAADAGPAPIPVSAGAGGKIVGIASRYLGSAYVWGGHSPGGFDCSGFTWYVYQQAGIRIPVHDLWGQVQSGPRVRPSDLEPGDLVFFQNTYKPGLSHSGVYIGGGRFINAVDERSGVTVSSMNDSYWGPRYFGASRPW